MAFFNVLIIRSNIIVPKKELLIRLKDMQKVLQQQKIIKQW